MSALAVSVIIPTRNRLPKLQACLARLLPQLDADDEVLIVDTGSTYGTQQAIRQKEGKAGAVIRLLEYAAGGHLGEARNLGIEEAANPLIAFLDDDALVAEDWAQRGRRDLARYEAVGGLAVPPEDVAWPEWWDERLGWLIGWSVPGHRGPEAGSRFYPQTANLWARTDVCRAVPFPGISGDFPDTEERRYSAGREDAVWWKTLRVGGFNVGFDPELVVVHDIDRARLNLHYLLDRAQWDARAWALREGTAEDLAPLAYQWWLQSLGLDHPAEENRGRAALSEHTYRRVMRARHDAALRALARKLAETDVRGESALSIRVKAQMHAGFRVARDRAKTTARRAALAVAPPRSWPEPLPRPRRMAVAAFGFVGDLTLLRSCLAGLVEAQPEFEILLLAPQKGRAIMMDAGGLEFVEVADDPVSLDEARRFLSECLREFNPDAIFAPYLHGVWGRATARLGRGPTPLLGFEKEDGLERMLDRARIPIRVETRQGEHEVFRLYRLFARAGLKGEPQPVRIEPTETGREEARQWREALPGEMCERPWLLLNPNAGHPNKEWTDEAWAETAARLLEETPHALVFNASRERPELTARLRARCGKEPRLGVLEPGSLERFIGVLALCAGVVTVDSGAAHLARAIGAPTLTLFGPHDPARWGDPWRRSEHVHVYRGARDLTPEELRGLPVNHQMRLIAPDDVMREFSLWKQYLKPECLTRVSDCR